MSMAKTATRGGIVAPPAKVQSWDFSACAEVASAFADNRAWEFRALLKPRHAVRRVEPRGIDSQADKLTDSEHNDSNGLRIGFD
jgi:hypothetical protein